MTTEEFKDAIRSVCDRDTSADPAGWSEDNPMWGHCAVVSLLAQEQFGGTLLRQSLAGVVGLEYVRSHYFNRLTDGTEVDFTIGQFLSRLPPNLPIEERSRERVLSYPDTRRRYELLKSRLAVHSSGLTNTTNTVISLGKLLLQFGRTNRATYHEDGVTPESDTDHTVMLGIIACACAQKFAPELDRGKIAQFALVHDLVEVYAQDTPTLRMMDASEKVQKIERERAALEQIDREFRVSFPWLPEMMHEYESLGSPEARFIKVLDKILPKITHILNGGVAVREQGHRTREDAARVYGPQRQQIEMYASEWPDVIRLWEGLVRELYAVLDNVQQ